VCGVAIKILVYCPRPDNFLYYPCSARFCVSSHVDGLTGCQQPARVRCGHKQIPLHMSHTDTKEILVCCPRPDFFTSFFRTLVCLICCGSTGCQQAAGVRSGHRHAARRPCPPGGAGGGGRRHHRHRLLSGDYQRLKLCICVLLLLPTPFTFSWPYNCLSIVRMLY
jgi:hypothetical protein